MHGHYRIRIIFFLFAVTAGAFAGTTFKATTTLTAETSNNTSAADTFTTQSNGNIGATNISKISMHTLLYAGSTAQIYVHTMPWFGFGDHMDVGYSSNDPVQAQRQIKDMASRGLDGAVIDWFGQGKLTMTFALYNQAVQDLRNAAEAQPNFHFAIMDDAQSLAACAATTACDVTQTLIDDLTYVYNTYQSSPAYLYYNNRPVVYFFGQEFYTINWTTVRNSAPGNPLFIFRNTEGFSYAETDGAFAWVEPETVTGGDPMGLGYMGTFDKQAQSLLPTYSNVAGYKGFNDSLASWSQNRSVTQQCGQTWLRSIALSGQYFSSASQMIGIQLVTWNDYEEGTEIESGIDNCVTISAATSGTQVSWAITGDASTVNHYTIFISQDGENLMWLADAAAGQSSVDVGQFGLAPGNYTVYVEAIGKPSLTNKMSGGVSLNIAHQPPTAVLNVTPSSGQAALTVNASTGASTDPDGTIVASSINFGDGSATVSAVSASHVYSTAGTYTVSATVTDNMGATASASAMVSVAPASPPPPTPPAPPAPPAPPTFQLASSGSSSASVQAGQTATYNLSLASNNGFIGVVSLSCAGAPSGVTCGVNPGSANFVSGTTSVAIAVNAVTTQQARLVPLRLRGLEFMFATAFGALLWGSGKRRRKRVLVLVGSFVISGLLACGGGGGSTPATTQATTPAAPTSATLTVTAMSGGQTSTVTLGLTITH